MNQIGTTRTLSLNSTMIKTTFCSLCDGDYSGSMIALLKRAGMTYLRNQASDSDIVVFNGGADIGTSIYDEQPINRSIPYKPSPRDEEEIRIFSSIKFAPVLKVGICRGAQLLNCLNGGTLWQHVNNHTSNHDVLIIAGDRFNEKIRVTSTHHQMMRPGPTGKVLAIADEATSKYAAKDTWHLARKPQVTNSYPDDHQDTEIVYYPDTHTLCIQGHPEYVPGSIFADYCIDLINGYLKEIEQSVD